MSHHLLRMWGKLILYDLERHSQTKKKIHRGPWIASVACRRSLWMKQIATWPWSQTCWGHMVLTGPQRCKWVKYYIFRLLHKLTSHALWPTFVKFDLMNMWRFLHFINKLSLVPAGLQLFKWGEFYILGPSYSAISDYLWPWYMTFDHMNIQRVR